METRRLITAIALSLGVFALWFFFMSWYQRTYPAPPPVAADSAQNSTVADSQTTPATNSSATSPTTGSATAPTVSAGLHAVEVPEGSGSSWVLGGGDTKTYTMQVYLTPHGGGIEKVQLTDFKDKAGSPNPYTFQEPYSGHPGSEPLASQSITVNGQNANLMGAPWKLVASSASSATYRVALEDSGSRVAEITKTYTLSPRSNPNEGYEVAIEQTIKSLGNQPLNVRQFFNGPTQPPREIERGGDVSVLAGFRDSPTAVTVAQHAMESGDFKAGVAPLDLTHDSDKHHALWAGEVSTYFNALVLPEVNKAFGQGFSVHAQALDPESSDNRQIAMTFETDPVALKAAGDQAVLPLHVYFGPKSRGVLKANNSIYGLFPRFYDLTLVIRGGWCGICTWDWLINVLFFILSMFHLVTRDWGLAIILLVLMVRVILHPLTKAGQVQMMKMQKMAPEMEKLKKKYADDKEGLNKAMMEYQKENMPAQLLGCAPMFLQMPIWIALWSALQSTFELRQAPFLYGLTWIKDLAKPDGLISFAHPVPLLFFGWHLSGINILPVLMAIATYVNQKYFMPKPTAVATPEQQQTQKMTQTMSMFFPLMFYTFPSGLNLYYLTSTTVGVIESKRIRDHIKEREEAEKAGKVFVPTRATRAARQRDDTPAPEPKKGGFMQRLADLQKRVDDMTKEPKNKGKGRKPD